MESSVNNSCAEDWKWKLIFCSFSLNFSHAHAFKKIILFINFVKKYFLELWIVQVRSIKTFNIHRQHWSSDTGALDTELVAHKWSQYLKFNFINGLSVTCKPQALDWKNFWGRCFHLMLLTVIYNVVAKLLLLYCIKLLWWHWYARHSLAEHVSGLNKECNSVLCLISVNSTPWATTRN